MIDDSTLNPTKIKRRWIWQVAVAILICGGLLVTVVWLSERMFQLVVPIAGLSRTTSMDIVAITLKEERDSARKTPLPKLRIPKAYLTDPQNRAGGKQPRVWIETGLPELTPRPAIKHPSAPKGTPERAAQERFWANGMVVTLEPAYEGDTGDVNGTWRESIGERGRRWGYVEREPVFGLRRIHEVPCMQSHVIEREKKAVTSAKPCDPERPSQEHFFAVNEKGDAMVNFVCLPPWTGEEGGCQTRFFHSGVRINLIFRRQELPRWAEFVDGTKRLVDKFLLKNEKT